MDIYFITKRKLTQFIIHHRFLACIVYWQAKEIGRVISECNPEIEGIDISLLEHVSPIEWDNVLLYGEYVLDPGLIK